MAWLRHLYELSREKAAARRASRSPAFEEFWQRGLARVPRARREPRHARRLPRRSGEASAEDAVGQDRDLSPSRSPRSATTTARAIRPGWSPPNGWARRTAERYPLHLISDQPHDKLHSQLDHGAAALASKVKGREPITHASRRTPPRAASPTATSCACSTTAAPASPAPRLERRASAAAWCGCRPAPGSTRLDPGRQPAAREARQSQRADARQGRLEAQAGLHRARPAWSRSSATMRRRRR